MPRTPTRSSSANQTSFGAAGPSRAPADVRALSTELIRWEGYCPHMFVDEAGQVTTGVGHRLQNVAAAVALPWRHRGTNRRRPPTRSAPPSRASARRDPGHKSLSYRFASDLVLAPGVAGALAIARVEWELLPGLRRLLVHFDGYPLSAQRALVDIAYTVGLEDLARFRNLIARLRARRLRHRRRTLPPARRAPNPQRRHPALFLEAAHASSSGAFVGKNARLDGG